MNNQKLTRNLMKIFTLLSLLVALILAIISFFTNWSFLTGFSLGCLCAIGFYWFNEWIFGLLLAKRRAFRSMFIISFLKFLLQMILFVAILIGIIFLNQFYNQNKNLDLATKRIDGIFNLFLFIVGCSMMMISIIIYHIGQLIMKRKKRNTKKEKMELLQ